MKPCGMNPEMEEQYDLTGKTIVPLATSGSSDMGNTNKELAGSCPGAELKERQQSYLLI